MPQSPPPQPMSPVNPINPISPTQSNMIRQLPIVPAGIMLPSQLKAHNAASPPVIKKPPPLPDKVTSPVMQGIIRTQSTPMSPPPVPPVSQNMFYFTIYFLQ
jgi:hypothetical protein